MTIDDPQDRGDMPVGDPVDATPATPPAPTTIRGRYATLEPLRPVHADALHRATYGHDELWTYLFDQPPADRAAFNALIDRKSRSLDRVYFAIVDQRSRDASGYAAYLRIEPAHRCIEVGDILFAPPLQRTRAATEAMYLMATHAFENLRYRRYEWKCDRLNASSMRSARRLGFSYEGTFRQHMIVKGRNRDTAWFAMLDSDWPARKAAFEQWLEPANFDENGGQRLALSDLITRDVTQRPNTRHPM